ncbi:MAG: hypothetical protein HYX52_00800 [Chloroflexi bacterium]|nr:hypothetical protein [Chloroflexota bacterium]
MSVLKIYPEAVIEYHHVTVQNGAEVLDRILGSVRLTGPAPIPVPLADEEADAIPPLTSDGD